jgi:hypothetical protein
MDTKENNPQWNESGGLKRNRHNSGLNAIDAFDYLREFELDISCAAAIF